MRISRFFLILFAGFACWTQAFSDESYQANPQEVESISSQQESSEPVKVELVAEDTAIQPGKPFWVAIHFLPEEGWHLYWKNPGDAGAAPEVEWTLPEGLSAGPLLWPVPSHFKVSGLSGLGYEKGFTLLAQITPSQKFSSSSSTVELKADVQWVACKDACVPGMPTVSLQLPVTDSTPSKNEKATQLFSEARSELPTPSTKVTAESQADYLLLNFPLPEGSNEVHHAEFYSTQQGLVDLSADQTLKFDHGSYYLQVPLLRPLSSEESDLSGILALSDNGGRTNALEVKTVAKPLIDQSKSNLASKSLSIPQAEQINTLEQGSESAIIEEGSSISGMGIGLAILAAFGGGLLLNLMPCVLPVLSLKVLSVVQAAGESKIERYKHSFAYLFGVLVSFWSLAGLLLLLRASGEEIGWGFQLQEPIFVGVLACLLFVMALNLFGVFEWGTSFAALGGMKKKKSGLAEALWSGVLATIVATPCTGPFLGASLGVAMALPPIGSFALFTVMGIGMALPFFLLTICPPLLRLLPKPGAWMVVLKQLMGFMLIASVLWLIWVWEAQTDFMAVMLMLGAMFILSIGAWFYGNWGQLNNTFKARMVSIGVAACTLAGAMLVIVNAAGSEDLNAKSPENSNTQMVNLSSKTAINLGWENFSPERLQELRDKGIPVFIDFTAKWCLLCQANKVVMHSSSVSQAFEQAGIVKMRADWTKRDKEITRFLKQFQRNGVPLYVLFKPGSSSPKIFPETLTTDMLIDAANELTP